MREHISKYLPHPIILLTGISTTPALMDFFKGDLLSRCNALTEDIDSSLANNKTFKLKNTRGFYTTLRADLLNMLEKNKTLLRSLQVEIKHLGSISAYNLIAQILHWLSLIAPINSDDIVTQEPINESMDDIIPLVSGHLSFLGAILDFHSRRPLRIDLDSGNLVTDAGIAFHLLSPYTNKPINTSDQEMIERMLALEPDSSELKEQYRFGNERLLLLSIWPYLTTPDADGLLRLLGADTNSLSNPDHPLQPSFQLIRTALEKQIRPGTLRKLCENGDISTSDPLITRKYSPEELAKPFSKLPKLQQAVRCLEKSTPEKNDELFKHTVLLLLIQQSRSQNDPQLIEGLRRVTEALVRKYQPANTQNDTSVLAEIADALQRVEPRAPRRSRAGTCLKYSLYVLAFLMVGVLGAFIEPAAKRFASSTYDNHFLEGQASQVGNNGFYMLDEGFSTWRHRCVELASFSCFAMMTWLATICHHAIAQRFDNNPRHPRP